MKFNSKHTSSEKKYDGEDAISAYVEWRGVSREKAASTNVWEYVGRLIEAVHSLEKRLNESSGD